MSVTDPLSRTTTRFSDAAGRTVTVTNPLNQMTRYEYDAGDRVTKMGRSAQRPDHLHLRCEQQPAEPHRRAGGSTTCSYDLMDPTTTRSDPLLRVETYAYDSNGNLREVRDQKQQVTRSPTMRSTG